ncbi:hypothetical protein G5V58_15750 [Nocardioides anomalus]|uniref:Uncharacterized protein n=1 Tax=Nocardioides anomalus TaxID=2712223 RepID=A0A6G6WFC7_9ACTN|nr:DUF5719 family protein [Nocardioides anomalus]QIG44038.1 hypothetical protein G5V58_15750 [Nocardioides anomalus]
MRRRFGVDVVLAVVLPVACALALFVVRPDRGQPGTGEPVATALSTSSLVCPSALTGTGTDATGVSVSGSADEAADGEVTVGLGQTSAPLRVRSGRVSAAEPGAGAAVVTGTGALAPGLVAGRSQSAPLAAVDCAPPVADQWFTGAGAEPTHDSVLELTNPNTGPAIADVTVRGPSGVVDVPALRGVSVPGSTTVQLDMGQVLPRRGELALEVHTTRGRLAVHVVDAVDDLGGAASRDWLPAQAEPSSENLVLGLVPGAGERTLVLANPGADEVRAELQVVTATSVFTPTGAETIRVAPGTTESVTLDDVLAQSAQDGALGVLVSSNGPVTTGLRQVVDGDLSLLAAGAAVDAPTAAVVPAGPKRLLLAGATGTGTATVTAYDAKGKALAEQAVDLAVQAGGDVELPDATALVGVVPEGAAVHAAVLLTGGGTAVVPLRELVLTGLVPDVRPGVP